MGSRGIRSLISTNIPGYSNMPDVHLNGASTHSVPIALIPAVTQYYGKWWRISTGQLSCQHNTDNRSSAVHVFALRNPF